MALAEKHELAEALATCRRALLNKALARGARIQIQNLVDAAEPLVEALGLSLLRVLPGGRHAMPARWEFEGILEP